MSNSVSVEHTVLEGGLWRVHLERATRLGMSAAAQLDTFQEALEALFEAQAATTKTTKLDAAVGIGIV